MVALFKLIRIQNLLFIAFIQLLIKFALFIPFEITTALPLTQYILLVISCICIAAAGYIVNDIHDVIIDSVNKPEKQIVGKLISEKTAFNYFVIFNVVGVGVGFYLANYIGRPNFAGLFIGVSAILYLYATYLKSIVVVKNIIIGILAALTLIIVGLFDLMPMIDDYNQETLKTIFSIILDYALFAFALTLIREIVKDIEDTDGDKNGNINTLPVLIGRKRTGKIAFVLGIITTAAVVYYVYTYLYQYQLAILYFLLLVIAPLLYFCIKIFNVEKKSECAKLSSILKIVMFLGMLSMALYPFLLLK